MPRVHAPLVTSTYDHSCSPTKVWLLGVKLQKRWSNARPREHHKKGVFSLSGLRHQFKP